MPASPLTLTHANANTNTNTNTNTGAGASARLDAHAWPALPCPAAHDLRLGKQR